MFGRRDRRKLFFDTVCTLADMNYDIYHATIDSEGDVANQLFYVRPRCVRAGLPAGMSACCADDLACQDDYASWTFADIKHNDCMLS